MDNGASSYRRFLDGDEAAFDLIVREYREPLIFFISRYVHDTCAAEDIAVDVFMYILVHPKRYNFKVSLKTYLFMLGRSRAIDFLRRQKRLMPLEEAVQRALCGEFEDSKTLCGLLMAQKKLEE